MIAQLRDVIASFEEDLALLNEKGINPELIDELDFVTEFLKDNFLVTNSPQLETENFTLQQGLVREHPEAVMYLDEVFIQELKKFEAELDRETPDEERILSAGTEVLQRLKTFSKISSPRTY